MSTVAVLANVAARACVAVEPGVVDVDNVAALACTVDAEDAAARTGLMVAPVLSVGPVLIVAPLPIVAPLLIVAPALSVADVLIVAPLLIVAPVLILVPVLIVVAAGTEVEGAGSAAGLLLILINGDGACATCPYFLA